MKYRLNQNCKAGDSLGAPEARSTPDLAFPLEKSQIGKKYAVQGLALEDLEAGDLVEWHAGRNLQGYGWRRISLPS